MKNPRLLISSVLLIVVAIISCKKAQKDYTSIMGGVRIWHGTVSSNSSYGPYGIGITQVIDTFALTIINNTTIKISGTVFHFVSQDNSTQNYTFNTSNDPNSPYDGSTLTYYYSTNNMHLSSGWGSATVQVNTDLYTP